MSEYECFSLSLNSAGIGHLQLNQPQRRNALTAAFWRDLPMAVRKLDTKGNCRVLVVSSTGPHFTAGIDVSMLTDLQPGEDQPHNNLALFHTIRRLQDSLSSFEDARMPVIAALQGGVIGGGLDLVSSCDMRFASEDAFFCIEETNLGLTADVGTFPRLQKLIPEGVVRELAYTGRRFTAQEALTHGLVNAVLPSHEALVEHAMNIASQIASKAPMAVHGCKRTINWARDHSTRDGLEQMAYWNSAALSWSEIREAFAARKEKRAGVFSDLPPLGE